MSAKARASVFLSAGWLLILCAASLIIVSYGMATTQSEVANSANSEAFGSIASYERLGGMPLNFAVLGMFAAGVVLRGYALATHKPLAACTTAVMLAWTFWICLVVCAGAFVRWLRLDPDGLGRYINSDYWSREGMTGFGFVLAASAVLGAAIALQIVRLLLARRPTRLAEKVAN